MKVTRFNGKRNRCRSSLVSGAGSLIRAVGPGSTCNASRFVMALEYEFERRITIWKG